MAEVLRLAVELMFSTHLYTFGGRCYKQKEGGPIGLRSTCALANGKMGPHVEVQGNEEEHQCGG